MALHYIKVRAFKEVVVVGWSWSGKALSGTDRMIAERWKADDAPFIQFFSCAIHISHFTCLN